MARRDSWGERWRTFWADVGLPHLFVLLLFLALVGALALMPDSWVAWLGDH